MNKDRDLMIFHSELCDAILLNNADSHSI